MPNLLSPGVAVVEKDFSNVVRQASSSTGGFVGNIGYGPIGQIVTITNETQFVSMFDKPNANTYKDFMCMSSFLAYTDDLRFVRCANRNTFNATSSTDDGSVNDSKQLTFGIDDNGTITSVTVPEDATTWNANLDDENTFIYVSLASNSVGINAILTPKITNGVLTEVKIVSGGTGYTQSDKVVVRTGVQIKNEDDYDTRFMYTNSPKFGTFASKYAGTKGNGLRIYIFDSSSDSDWKSWEYNYLFSDKPGTSEYVSSRGGSNDEFHIVIVDGDGTFSGTQDEILAYYPFVSKAIDAVNATGESIYWRKVLASGDYVYALCAPSSSVAVEQDEDEEGVSAQAETQTGYTKVSNWDSLAQGTSFGRTPSANWEYTLSGGTYVECNDSDYIEAWEMLKDPEIVDVSLIFAGACSDTVLNHLMSNVVTPVGSDTGRAGTTMLFFSPPQSAVVANNRGECDDIITWAKSKTHSNYFVCDCNWKYMYDRYNEVYRWTPCCADVAGLCAYTDNVRDAWWSPAGFNRGMIKNAIKLAWSPNRTERDKLYQQSINPIYVQSGEGIVLFGDKTFTLKPSAFDRINVRRLFIVLEKSISASAKYLLFEFNDEITRTQFIAMVEPFLRNVQGARGITDYRVVCDESNNTPYVIDNNQFVGDIYIRPNYSINYIYLNFNCVGNSVSFSEIVGG